MMAKPASWARRLSAVQRAYDFLNSEGLSPLLLPGGDAHWSQLAFEHKGGHFAVGVDERDRDFLEVTLTLCRRTPLDEITALRLASAIQGFHGLVKVCVGGDPSVLHFLAPVLLRGLPPTRALLLRCVDVLRRAAAEARDLLEESPRAQA